MKDRSKKLTVINTERKPSVESGKPTNQTGYSGYGGSVSVNLSDYLLKRIWDKIFEIRTTEEGEEYIFCKTNFVSQFGVTMYADEGLLDLPSIYEGLPIDMDTLYWVLDENGKKLYLKAKGGEGNGSFGKIEKLGEGNAITDVEVIKGGEGEADKLMFTKGMTFIDEDYLKKNYYTKTDIDNTFLTENGAADLFVTVDDRPQDIDGEKNFIGSLMVNGMPIVYDYRGFWKLEGDLLVTGGISSFSSDTRYTPSTVMDGIVCDERTISADGGYLHFVGEIKGGISNVIPDGNGNAVTSLVLSSDGKSVTYYKGLTFAEKQYVDDNFSKKTYVDETFVTLKGNPQTIESQKNFIGGLHVNGNPIVYNAEQGYWKLEGDLLVTGGIASFSDDTAYDPTSIMDAIVCDEQTITAEEVNGVKMLRVIGGGTGSGVDEEAVRELIESYKYLDKVATINIYNSSGSSIMSYDGTTNRTLTLSKSHVGLANVENTALSTWTGNSHISKVGTITSGTWNGTSIGASYLPTATTSAKGVASFDSSYFSVSSGKVSFTGGGVKIVSSLPSSRTKNTLYVITG